jgi:hypothetical protein
MGAEESRQAIVDQEHLKMLSIGYVVSACLDGAFSLLGVFYAVLGVFFKSVLEHAPVEAGQVPPPPFVAWIFVAMGMGVFLTMVVSGILKALVYQRLRQRRSRIFCMVVAAFSCIWIPYGTLLGVFTFLVLARPSVVRAFEGEPAGTLEPQSRPEI